MLDRKNRSRFLFKPPLLSEGPLNKSHLLPWVMVFGTIWSLAFLASLYLNIERDRDMVISQALSHANTAIDKDMTYRHLVSGVGGVYMPTDRGIEPNPLLSHIPHREVITREGRELTLVNTSYFTRLAHDSEAASFPKGVRGHVTSLKPLRPANAPDEWEIEALQAFAAGAEEWRGVYYKGGREYFRLMRPRMVEAACLECHTDQGYKLGDVLGGISVLVPMDSLRAASEYRIIQISLWHFVLWLAGMLGLMFGYHLLRNKEYQTRFAALHDVLTGLPNRALFMDRLSQRLESAKRHDHTGAVLFLDLDRFKTINDSLGHVVGDGLLREVGGRLKGIMRGEDTVARLGGDEFVVLLAELDHDAEAIAMEVQSVADKILDVLAQPHWFRRQKLYAPSSIGIALFSQESQDVNEVLQQADVAMYRAKESGGNCSRFFLPSMQGAAEERLEVENALRRALEHNEFLLHYQPIVDIREPGRIVGAEALVRWKHPQRGIVLPGEFIGVAEETGLIFELGDWVLQEVCRQIQKWNATLPNLDFGRISINISPRQFQHSNFVERLTGIVSDAGVDSAGLYLELTENLLVNDVENVIVRMTELKTRGFRFAIDDFGTGYSSLTYLKRLPLDTLKIDRSFVRDITSDPNDATIVESILAMSSRMGFRVLAEGVETEEQLEFLTRHRCDLYQGYLFSQPVPAEELEKLLLKK
jgi:diguanylate cyclase (GGDEF)-like protein